MHHAADKGHASCVAFLINFRANIFAVDNNHRSPLDVANLKGRTDCVMILDEAANKQTSLNPKRVAKLKDQALKDAEMKIKECEKIQDKHQSQMNKNFNRTGTVNSAKGTLSGSVGARFSTPSTVRSLTKGLRDTLQLKLKKKNKNTIDRDTVSSFILATDESSGDQRTKITDVFSEIDEDLGMEEEKQSVFNRPGLGNIVFRRNVEMEINTEFEENFSAEDELTIKVGNALFAEDAKNGNDGDNINVAWNDDDVEIDEEEESSPLKVFLESHALLDLHVTLLREKIDLDSLLLCSNEDLQNINIQLGPRKKLLNAVEKRKQSLTKPGKISDTKL